MVDNNGLQHDIEEELEGKVQNRFFLLRFLRYIFVSDKKLGEFNGIWAGLFKIAVLGLLCLIPTFFGWMVWITSMAYSAENHIFNTEDFQSRLIQLEKSDKIQEVLSTRIQKLSDKIDSMPPLDWRRRIETVESKLDNVEKTVNTVDKTNSTEHARISTALEINNQLLREIKSQR
jgi:hypothetical protein